MIDHPNSKGPITEPGCLGVICFLAAPVVAGVFGFTGIGLILGVLAVFAGVCLLGAVFGKR